MINITHKVILTNVILPTWNKSCCLLHCYLMWFNFCRISTYFCLCIALMWRFSLMIGPQVIAGPRFCLVPHSLGTELCCSFSGREPKCGSYSERYKDWEDWSVGERHKVFDSLQYKTVYEKDISSLQNKAGSHNFLFTTFCGLVRIKS